MAKMTTTSHSILFKETSSLRNMEGVISQTPKRNECRRGSWAFYASVLFTHDLADGNCAGTVKGGDYFELLLIAERPTSLQYALESIASMVSDLENRRGLLGENNMVSRHNIAWVYGLEGRIDEAIEFLEVVWRK
jgi:hypothetical protein